MNSENKKQLLLAIGSIVAMVAAITWITRGFLQPDLNVKLHQGIGEAMAEQTDRLLKGTGSVVVVTQDPAQSPVLNVQLEAFRKAIRHRPRISVIETVVLRDEQQKLGPGLGLSTDQFLAVLEKHRTADAIVSFVGTPEPKDQKIVSLGKLKGPKIIAQTRKRTKLKPLFENSLLHAAVVPRFEFPAPGTGNPSSPREWFDLSFQVVSKSKAP